MNWHRESPGVYVSGPYKVEKVLGRWYACGPINAGPGVIIDTAHQRKDQAQGLCYSTAGARAANPDVEPVVYDVVVVADGDRRGYVGSIMRHDNKVLYCIKFPRGRRLCLLRHEFRVVTP